MTTIWNETIPARWHTAHAALVEAFRPLYLMALEQLAETLRPGFEAGLLWGYRDDDTGLLRLGAACSAAFGLDLVQRGVADWTGNKKAAAVVLALSPSSGLVDGEEGNDWSHEALRAREAVLFDVLTIARARRWYRPEKDEAPKKLDASWVRAA